MSWLAVMAVAALSQVPEQPMDSARVAQLLGLLARSDPAVCELAGQTLANNFGFYWGWSELPTPMSRPMTTPMPMPMIDRLVPLLQEEVQWVQAHALHLRLVIFFSNI